MPNERTFSGGVERLRHPERLARLEVERVLNLCLEAPPIHSVLDVGTGSGVFAEAFAGRNLTVAGLDLNEEMLSAARTFVPGAQFRLGAMEELPFADASFDLVFQGLVLHEADDLAKALSEARRVNRIRSAVLEWPAEPADFGPPVDHRLHQAQVERAAAQAGFSKVVCHRLTWLVLYLLLP